MVLCFERPQLDGFSLLPIKIRLFLHGWKLVPFDISVLIAVFGSFFLLGPDLSNGEEYKPYQHYDVGVVGLGERSGHLPVFQRSPFPEEAGLFVKIGILHIVSPRWF